MTFPRAGDRKAVAANDVYMSRSIAHTTKAALENQFHSRVDDLVAHEAQRDEFRRNTFDTTFAGMPIDQKIVLLQQILQFVETGNEKIKQVNKCIKKATKDSHFLPTEATRKLHEWAMAHLHNPYPTSSEQDNLASLCVVLSRKQVYNWFANFRRQWPDLLSAHLLEQQQQNYGDKRRKVLADLP
eukprot:TRINITY_DN5232_c0_g2_i2.p1 TRINITY_DN5232_c0_g2~~TRINITY_DN5232_c0_g2_i2.p1  ORF type:complete len:185 (-),score=27.63 TRINITY_DN5232_c0_g2_i2:71-625(-)